MIKSISHLKLRQFYKSRDAAVLGMADTERLTLQLEMLDRLGDPHLMDMPGWNLRLLAHPNTWAVDADRLTCLVYTLKGNDVYSVTIKKMLEIVKNNAG